MDDDKKRPAFNPRPAGEVRPGSGTDALLRVLKINPGRWFWHSELILMLGRSKGEIDWALRYLTGQGVIRAEVVSRHRKKPAMRYALVRTKPATVHGFADTKDFADACCHP